ncbi:hypothetical protein BHE74_00014607 [Ensete ventricosum]|uniref:Uncharacterized protein n=1 Tax=Ensete ventricosum TaxID=4639 RepID=A0A427B4Y4_ENSVE|nr:hypothetical protein B296_00017411 [Ensete ventricosum]RWW17978.1 hypothetical protein GW17_00018064 [Ensete ventricosum]RWW77234.1 hypothetical protein BHE74_00014607 [Ensete ventricosum]
MQVGHTRGRTELLVLYFVGCFTVCGSRPWMEAAFPGPAFCGASFCSISFLFFFLLFWAQPLCCGARWMRQGRVVGQPLIMSL